MTIIELAVFMGLSTSVAFCFAFPFQDGTVWALTIGVSITSLSITYLIMTACVRKLFKKHGSGRIIFWVWIFMVLSFVLFFGIYAIRHSWLALLGIPATCAAIAAIAGPRAWRKASLLCFAIAVLVSIALHFFGHLPVNTIRS